MRILPVFILSSAMLLSGCAGVFRSAEPAYKVVAASSEDQPRWLGTKASEDARFKFYVGRTDVASDLSSGESLAEAQVRAVIRAEIRDMVRRDVEARLGASLAGKREALNQALTASLDAVELKGLAPVERYWERLEIEVDDGMRYAYRLALFVRMPKEGFEATRAEAYRAVATEIGL